MHALRLIGSGLFDAHPRLQIILGHLGENLPYGMWRVDNRNALVAERSTIIRRRSKIGEYFCANFHLTTSGNFRTQSLIDAMLEIGADRIMFSADWPFENIDHAADLVRRLPDQRDRPASRSAATMRSRLVQAAAEVTFPSP